MMIYETYTDVKSDRIMLVFLVEMKSEKLVNSFI